MLSLSPVSYIGTSQSGASVSSCVRKRADSAFICVCYATPWRTVAWAILIITLFGWSMWLTMGRVWIFHFPFWCWINVALRSLLANMNVPIVAVISFSRILSLVCKHMLRCAEFAVFLRYYILRCWCILHSRRNTNVSLTLSARVIT